MKRIFPLIILVLLLVACGPSTPAIQTAIAQTQTVALTFTPYPTSTYYPTYTPRSTTVVTKVFVWTPTVNPNDVNCIAISEMDYSDNSRIALELQVYVGGLPDVRTVSYVIPERLYSNTLSELFHVTYTNSNDGKTYSKRYIVYIEEFGWKNAVFSIDGQCWIDPPH